MMQAVVMVAAAKTNSARAEGNFSMVTMILLEAGVKGKEWKNRGGFPFWETWCLCDIGPPCASSVFPLLEPLPLLI